MISLLLAAAAGPAKAAAHGATALATAAPAPLPMQISQPPAPMQVTWFQAHASWLTHGIAGLFILSVVSLVVLLAVQTTKQEGLSGSIGGRVESSYRGRLGAEEQLKRITGVAAVSSIVTAVILSLTGI